ncbi:uncharacterized protein L969DRAFT_97145 [Mixia osmundae IAM 14324]|uniref:Coatomer subunit zeta n=1 Tax=Mixia osmundae (strain CBS 9802 / IAM 14324 / JCM 22182 / KY 12970) TaxID=764103 RepID=G7E1U3_MIXOS|nr:uncharacterized protein L969DRAFT_97145 [Mixia osmundae IAM 14324]KEI36749.1 hypothetical protein L969DRAFT_97145 [Mixia osmundae IAM 14324]GAA96803.1 hypothetical protein E5Q_03475 [Mixia osmundae IAM 14324]
MNLSLFSTTAIVIIDSDGNRLLAKYFQPVHSDTSKSALGDSTSNAKHSSLVLGTYVSPFKTLKDQKAFEAAIWDKTRRAQGDIILYASHLVLFRASIDLTFYIIGPEGENELMLQSALNAFYDAVSLLLRHQVEKRSVLENLDLVVLALDETVDDGIILETDSNAIASRVSRPRPDSGTVDLSNITINEQTIMNAFSTVRDRMAQRILAGGL